MARTAHHEMQGPEGVMHALERQPDDINVIIQFAEAPAGRTSRSSKAADGRLGRRRLVLGHESLGRASTR